MDTKPAVGGLFLLAGESSGDLIGSKLALELCEAGYSDPLWGVAGPLMKAAGVRPVMDMEAFQIMGFVGVVRALPTIKRQLHTLQELILKRRPEAVILIDYPGLNLRLAGQLREAGYEGKIIQYVCPSVWAWGAKRIPKMVERLDLLLTLFPFEPQYFEKTGLETHFVGHPAMEELPTDEIEAEYLVGIFPGSRAAEIRHNLEIQLEVAHKMHLLHPDLRLAISVAKPELEPAIRRAVEKSHLPVEFHVGSSLYPLMRRCRMAIATCGTVTLELALYKIPTVVVYRPSLLNALLARFIFHINLPHYSIANILCNKTIFPEHVHWVISTRQVTQDAERLFAEGKVRADSLRGCEEVRRRLKYTDGARRAAEAILKILT